MYFESKRYVFYHYLKPKWFVKNVNLRAGRIRCSIFHEPLNIIGKQVRTLHNGWTGNLIQYC